jgi:hypothetical protein
MVMAGIKGSFFGVFLTWLVALFIGSAGSSGDFLQVHLVRFGDLSYYWSWPLFIIATGIAAALVWMMDS